MEKVRHVDFYSDEWLAGTATLGVVDVGIYATAIAMIYSHGGSVELEELKRFVRCRGRTFDNALARLLKLGKLILDGTQLVCKRCAIELQKAQRRIANSMQNGSKGGRPSRKINDLTKPAGSDARAEPKDQPNIIKSLSKKESGDLGRSAPFRGEAAAPESEAEIAPSVTIEEPGGEDRSPDAAPPDEPESLTQEERAERMAILAAVLADLNSKGPAARVRAPVAHANTIHDAKREAWLRGLHEWAGERLGGDDRMQAFEAINCAWAAGSRNATPTPVRHYLDQLDRVQRAETAQMQGVA